MTLYNDSFITSLNQPVELILGQWLNVALKLEDTEGHPELKLIVPDCKATPSDKPNDPIYFTLFSDKCAVDPTLGFFPLNSTTFGFRYQTFKFYKYANIYIHCNAWVCLTTEKNHDCDRTCNTTNPIGRRKRDASSRDVYQLLSQPLNFKQQEENSLIDRGGGWQVDLATTQRPSTLSATSAINIRSTKPSTPVSTVNPSGTTSKYIKVIDVGSLTTDASIVTESVTDKNAPKTSPDIKSQTTVQAPASLTTKQSVSVSPTARNGLTSTIPNNDQVETSLSSSPSLNPFKFASSTVKWHTTATTKQMVSGLPTSSNGFNLTTINQTNKTNVKTKTSTFSPSNSPTKMDSYVTTQIKGTPNNFKHAHDPNKLYFGGLGGKFILMSDASRLHVSTNAVISAIVCWLLLV
ncbi:uncharacterized protein [Mytilus edulis]|uniref:uncharacterized protein n=1 Tax=Mytilus edulis TaxID=6550 RepID=UPI0039EF5DF9